ncbi:ATP-binding protein [Pectobacterium actinidiae]|uniref:ATP-binding protein n=1 Tax=Pectobacterium actinidiae TaxID=1507808 RepID=UPI004040C554
MGAIRLKTNQHRLISNLRYAFSPGSMLGELLQNARRAKASHIVITADESSITVSDDGSGIADLQSLIFIAESGWDHELQARENAFGMGVLSTLYFSRHLTVHSGSRAFSASTATIIRGDAIDVYPVTPRIGTEIRLDGVQSPWQGETLPNWVRQQLKRLCEAFPVRVSFNGDDIARPLMDTSLIWRETPVGRVLVNLDAPCRRWRCFLQGLPIGGIPLLSEYHVVLLRDDMIARLPDRQHLLHEEEDNLRIQAAIDRVYREALLEAKSQLTSSEFITLYGEACLTSSNADLLNDVRFARLSWFRNWETLPPGFVRFWDRSAREGIISDEALAERGVWCIENDDDDSHTAEAYIHACDGYLLEEPRLDRGHWLYHLARTISPDRVTITYGSIVYGDGQPQLAAYVELFLVDTLSVSLEGEQTVHPVSAVRRGDTIYLTAQAGNITRMISDYVFDDRYDEGAEHNDAKTVNTFISVGRSQTPELVIEALLSEMRHISQPKLAGATVRLVFDDNGRLQTVAN